MNKQYISDLKDGTNTESVFSINLLLKEYEVSSLPVILVDEKIKIEQIDRLEDIRGLLN